MPYNHSQHRLFQAAAHNPSIAKRVGIPSHTASKMAHEGIKKGAMMAAKLKGK